MEVDLIRLHEKTYGYQLRSGKRGSYKYWYKNYSNGKLYEGKKPDAAVIEYFEKIITHPSIDEITENPWENYNSKNPQMIYSKESNVPFNKLGITNRDELELYESYLLSVAYRRILENLKSMPEYYLPINREKILNLHRIIFHDLYDWAGKYRNINMSKEGFPFPPADLINSEMRCIDKNLFNKINYNAEATLEELAELLAYISAELTIIHPFREGNGRIIRVILDIISIAFNKKPANWGQLTKKEDKERYLTYMYAGYKKDYEPLTEFIYTLLLSGNS